MKSPKTQLTPTEAKTLLLLSYGHTSEHVQERTGLHASSFHVHCHNIRQKTGIKDIFNQDECREFMRNLRPVDPRTKSKKNPTPGQLEVMTQIYMNGLTVKQLAEQRGQTEQCIRNILCMGINRAGLKKFHGWERARAVRTFLGGKPDPMDDPMF